MYEGLLRCCTNSQRNYLYDCASMLILLSVCLAKISKQQHCIRMSCIVGQFKTLTYSLSVAPFASNLYIMQFDFLHCYVFPNRKLIACNYGVIFIVISTHYLFNELSKLYLIIIFGFFFFVFTFFFSLFVQFVATCIDRTNSKQL